jgi:hypothetical protein
MVKKIASGTMVWLMILSFSAMTMPARAGMIGTQQMMETLEKENSVERVRPLLGTEKVRDQLLAMGVAPEEIEGRLAALTSAEIAQVEQHLDAMPAGGNVFALVGAVFVVLLILELVGVTNIFTQI